MSTNDYSGMKIREVTPEEARGAAERLAHEVTAVWAGGHAVFSQASQGVSTDDHSPEAVIAYNNAVQQLVSDEQQDLPLEPTIAAGLQTVSYVPGMDNHDWDNGRQDSPAQERGLISRLIGI